MSLLPVNGGSRVEITPAVRGGLRCGTTGFSVADFKAVEVGSTGGAELLIFVFLDMFGRGSRGFLVEGFFDKGDGARVFFAAHEAILDEGDEGRERTRGFFGVDDVTLRAGDDGRDRTTVFFGFGDICGTMDAFLVVDAADGGCVFFLTTRGVTLLTLGFVAGSLLGLGFTGVTAFTVLVEVGGEIGFGLTVRGFEVESVRRLRLVSPKMGSFVDFLTGERVAATGGIFASSATVRSSEMVVGATSGAA